MVSIITPYPPLTSPERMKQKLASGKSKGKKKARVTINISGSKSYDGQYHQMAFLKCCSMDHDKFIPLSRHTGTSEGLPSRVEGTDAVVTSIPATQNTDQSNVFAPAIHSSFRSSSFMVGVKGRAAP